MRYGKSRAGAAGASRTAFGLASVLLGAGCAGSGNDGSSASGGAISMPPPTAVVQTRAVTLDALVVSATVDGVAAETRREGEVWTLVTSVLPGRTIDLEVLWSETLDGVELPLASFSGALGPFAADTSVAIDPGDYRSDPFDEDADGLSNLAERDAGSDPFNANDPGGDASPGGGNGGADGEGRPGAGAGAAPPEVRVPTYDLAGGPEIDGRFDDLWNQATFAPIDRLVIDDNPAGRAAPRYQWAMMHDRDFLYLFVLFEGTDGEPHTPFADSPRYFNDDGVNLFFDGDGSRGASLGSDDRYLHIPLPITNDVVRPPVRAPFSGAPTVPPGLEYGVCACLGGVAGWELRVPLAELGIEIGRPFGFEVHLDQDLDGGDRDERWGWAYPAESEREPGPTDFESPALWGTVRLE